MSFYNIKDKRKRDETIKEYLALKDRIKRRNVAEKVGKTYHQQHLIEKYEPVTKSTKEMAEKITDELKPIKKEIINLNSLITARPKAVAKRKIKRGVKREAPSSDSDIDEGEEDEEEEEEEYQVASNPLVEKFVYTFSDDKSRKAKLDTTFGLRKEGEEWKIGSKDVAIGPDDSMYVGDVTFSATPGFWSLVTDKFPRNYTKEDLSRYKELLHESNALYQEYDPETRHPRSSKSHKGKRILKRIWKEFRDTGIVVDELDESGHNADTSRFGNGVKMYLQKDGISYALKKTKDDAMQISPCPHLTGVYGDGLYLRRAGSGLIYRGEGLILGPQSPFKNIPILSWIL